MVDKPPPDRRRTCPARPHRRLPAGTPPRHPRRSPGHRGADMRDTVAEMAERAQIISQEAGTQGRGMP